MMKFRTVLFGSLLTVLALGGGLYAQTGFHPAGTVFGNNAASSQALPSPSTSPRIGRVGSRGTLTICGETSGCITDQPQAAAGTYNWNRPTSAGTAGHPLLSGGGGSTPMAFGIVGPAAGGTGTNTTATSGRYLKGDGTNWVTSNGSASGTGSCGAGTVVTALNSDAAPTCTAAAGDVTGPASSTDNAAARFDSTTGKLIQNSALIIADTTGRLTRSGNGGIQVQGTNTNDSATAGDKGEYVSSAVVLGSAVSLTTATATDITSISLTAGDWDVTGQAGFDAVGSTDWTQQIGSTSRTSATLSSPGDPTQGYASLAQGTASPATSSDNVIAIPTARMSLASTTTVYLVLRGTFSAGTLAGYGYIAARRVR